MRAVGTRGPTESKVRHGMVVETTENVDKECLWRIALFLSVISLTCPES
jgi:hypothetical protein